MNKRIEDGFQFRFKACKPPSCGCPDVEYDNGLVTVTDDWGGKVKLTMQELAFIAEKTNNLIELAKEDLLKQQAEMQEEIKALKASKGV
jgi:hypothetical protein